MIFDVVVKEGLNAGGYPIFNTYRVHDSKLSAYLRDVQNKGKYVQGVIPLFRNPFKKTYYEDNEEAKKELEVYKERV